MNASVALLLLTLFQDAPTGGYVEVRPAVRAGQLRLEVAVAPTTPRTLEIYDVRDLCAPPASEEAAGATSAETVAVAATTLLEMVRLYLEPRPVDGQDDLQMMPTGTLIARLPADGHAWLHRFLQVQRAERGMFDLQVWVAFGDRGAFDTFIAADAAYAALDADAVARLTSEASRRAAGNFPSKGVVRTGNEIIEYRGIEVVSSPRLVTLNRQRASVSILAQVSYVKDWEARVIAPGNQVIADPTVDVLDHGITGEFRITLLDTDRAGCEAAFTHTAVKEPIATRKIHLPVPGMHEVEIGLPEITTVRLSATAVLGMGQSLLFCGPTQDGTRDVAVLLTVKYVKDASQLGK